MQRCLQEVDCFWDDGEIGMVVVCDLFGAKWEVWEAGNGQSACRGLEELQRDAPGRVGGRV